MKLSAVIAQSAPLKDPVLLRGDIMESGEVLRKLGYNGMEIHLREPSEIDADKLLEYCENSDMAVSAFATGMAKRIDNLCLISDDATNRQQAVLRVKDFLKMSVPFGAGVIIGSMRGMLSADTATAKTQLDRAYASFSELADFAEKTNAVIFIEAINRYENNYLNTAAETAEFLDKIGSKNIKINLDSFHMNIEETDISKAIKACGKYIGHIHLADNTRQYVGSGTFCFKKLFSAAKEAGYNGWYSLECNCNGCAEETLTASKNAFDTFFN